MHFSRYSFGSQSRFQINLGEMFRSGIRVCVPFVRDPDFLTTILFDFGQVDVVVWLFGTCELHLACISCFSQPRFQINRREIF